MYSEQQQHGSPLTRYRENENIEGEKGLEYNFSFRPFLKTFFGLTNYSRTNKWLSYCSWMQTAGGFIDT